MQALLSLPLFSVAACIEIPTQNIFMGESSAASVVVPESARVVVAIDFGTTFSGFAYARTAEPEKVFKLYDWPSAGKAGAKSYCKTQTSLFYVPSPIRPAHFELKNWGWSALLQFTQSARRSSTPLHHPGIDMCSVLPSINQARLHSTGHEPESCIDVLSASSQGLDERVGFFATKFKLSLSPGECSAMHKLPGDITVERMIIDYLQCLSDFIISELQLQYGKHFGKEDVQWCLTVPAIWDERAKQVMKMCAEKAGMVKGGECPTPHAASPYPLGVVLEPEAASIYCQQRMKCLNMLKGDKFLVVDVGGGTIDIVVHEKADNNPKNMSVHEVVGSYGDVGGGTFVDSHFFHFLSKKIGCFKEFCREHTSIGISIYAWWQGVKMGFDGDGYIAEMHLPRKLSEAWEKHDNDRGIKTCDEDYDELKLESSDMKRIFDPEVDKVLNLIGKQVENVRVLMVVGGFSASPYLRKCIQSKFWNRVEEVIIPEDPGSAICHGAVQLHIGNNLIHSRIARRTYGISTTLPAMPGDPPKFVYVDEDGKLMCNNSFYVFVRAGERVPLNKSFTKSVVPSSYGQRLLPIHLYSSTNMYPKYTKEVGAVKEGSFDVDISEGMVLEKSREVAVTMHFGASLIQVSAKRVNFGKANIDVGLSVKYCTD